MPDLDPFSRPAPGRPSGEPETPEVIEVEVERLGERPSAAKVIGGHLWNRVGPVLLAMFIDVGDLFTIGPLLFLGVPLGMLAGYVFSGFLGVSPTWRIAFTVITGVYWVVPFTTFLPLATITAAVVQIVAPDKFKEEPFGARP